MTNDTTNPIAEMTAVLGKVRSGYHNVGQYAFGHFVAWRLGEGPVSIEPVYWSIDTEWADYDESDLVETEPVPLLVRERIAANGHRSFRVEQIGKPVDDPELRDAAAEAMGPVEVDDPVLGRLVLDPKLRHEFTGSIQFDEVTIRLSIPAQDRAPEPTSVTTLQAAVSDLASVRDALHTEIAHQLLPGLIDGWTQDGDPPADAAAFTHQMRLVELAIDPHNDQPGGFHAWLTDGDWFGGHIIRIAVKNNRTFGRASVMG